MIIAEKAIKEEMLLEDIVDITMPTEMAWVSNPVDLAGRYNWVMRNVNLDVAKE